MSTPNLFSALSKYDGSRAAEDYLTEAFVYVLNYLLENDKDVGIELVNWLCGGNDQFRFAPNENVRASSQATTKYGRPDIAIYAPDETAPQKLVYVEVKKDAPLREGQLTQYGKALDESSATHAWLVLVTRFATDPRPEDRQPDHAVRWFEVHDWLQEAQLTSPEARYLTREFTRYLEAHRMAIQAVGPELWPGLEALANLEGMLNAAVEAAGLHKQQGQTSFTRGYYGFNLDGGRFWCGLGYEQSLPVWFEEWNCPPLAEDVLHETRYRFRRTDGGHPALTLDLADAQFRFFALDKSGQLDLLTAFIRTAHETFKQAVARANPPEVSSGQAGAPDNG